MKPQQVVQKTSGAANSLAPKPAMAHRARGVLRTSKQERTRLCYYSGHGTFKLWYMWLV